MNNIEFKGNCKGVQLINRGNGDNHICFKIMTEDDENWYTSDDKTSSYWIDELINQLKIAKAFIEQQTPEIDENGRQWGYKFNE